MKYSMLVVVSCLLLQPIWGQGLLRRPCRTCGQKGAESATEKTRKAVAELFPGWSLDTQVYPRHRHAGIQASHRGRTNIVFVHPKNRNTPAVLSRTVALSDKSPCLHLNMASWSEDSDFLLSVRVNGEEVLPKRLVCTPDFSPWEDVVLPLCKWRGSTVKIEIVITDNNSWYEHAYFARIEICEGTGDTRIDGKATVDGYTWSYRVNNGEAMIVAETDGRMTCAVSPSPIGHVTIPETLDGVKVTGIGYNAFCDCSGITSVTIPSTVKIIGRGAFARCRGLTSLVIPDGVVDIGRESFLGCTGLASMTIPDSVKGIWRNAFRGCGGLTSLTIPSGVTYIECEAFRGCCALTEVTISSTVTNIGRNAFCDCSALTAVHVDDGNWFHDGNQFYKSENGLLLTKDGTTLVRGVIGNVTIPMSVTNIESCAFEGCCALRSIQIPSSVKVIGPYAFRNCKGLASVMIPEGVTGIGHDAFHGCSGLESVTLPKGVEIICNSAFTGTALTSVEIPSGVKTLERGAFSWCGGLKSVTIPESVTSIGRDVFYNCGALESVNIPTGVTSIGQGAFCGCNGLSSVEIPETVAKIDQQAFLNCRGLKSVTMRGSCPASPNNVFEGCGNLKTIHVPANSKSWAGLKEWQGKTLAFDGPKMSDEQLAKESERQAKSEQMQNKDRPRTLGGALRARRLQRQQEAEAAAAKQREEQAARDAERQAQAEREKLLAIQEELKRAREAKAAAAGAKSVKEATKNRTSTQSIIDGMLKVPEKDYWLSETELTQGQWESVMGNNPSEHKGANLPVECVSRNDCDVFLEKLNQTKEVQGSRFVFSLPTEGEWLQATRVEGDILDRAWVQENSSNQTHAVATKAPNALGFYDMQGNVWEWLANDQVPKGCRRGGAFSEGKGGCSVHRWIHTPRGRRYGCCGLRLAAHLRPTNNMGEPKESKATDVQAKIDAAKAAVDNIKGAVTTWMLVNKKSMPPSSLSALVKADGDKKPQLDGGEEALVDPWGQSYMIQIKGKWFAIVSAGPDTKFHTADDIRTDNGGDKEQGAGRLVRTSEAKAPAAKNQGLAAPTNCATEKSAQGRMSVAEKLSQCDFLLNKDFKKDAKFYLCLFSASWCPPCRREMPRIAKTYVETLKDDPDIELVHFSRDQNDEKAMAWAKEHDVKFPVVKPKGGNPLDLHSRGIPHLFIVKADGTLVEEGHPMRIFNEEKFKEIKTDRMEPRAASVTTKEKELTVDADGYTWTYTMKNGTAVIGAITDGRCRMSERRCAISPNPTGHITIPSILNGVKVVGIGENALCGCKGIKSITIPEGVTCIGRCAFDRCKGLTGVKIPDSVTTIGEYSFDWCGSITNVILGSGVTTIGSCAFRDCDGLTSIRIPKSVVNIDHSAFIFCSGLKEFVVDPSNQKFTAVNGLLLSKDGSELLAGIDGDVIVPDGVKSVGLQAFCQYSGLTSVKLPGSLTDIGGSSFFSCVALKSITIPASVKSIGRNAFGGCRSLTSVTMCGERPESPDDVFRSCRNLKSIHVSANVKSWAGMKEWQGIPLVFDAEMEK